MQPKVLLCDEATSALDPRTAESILNLLKEINEKTGITIIVVAHQLSVIRNICTHMAILEDGHLACHGATTEIFMQAPAALRRLQGNRENHANLSVLFCEQDQFVFSRMVRDQGARGKIRYLFKLAPQEGDLLPNGRKGGGRQCLTRNFGMSGCDISIS